jgi:hypothetical protein
MQHTKVLFVAASAQSSFFRFPKTKTKSVALVFETLAVQNLIAETNRLIKTNTQLAMNSDVM